MRYVELGEHSGRLVGQIFIWIAQIVKTAVYTPVVLGFAAALVLLFVNIIFAFPAVIQSTIFQAIIPQDVSINKQDILFAYGQFTFIFSILISLVSVLTGKRSQISSKKLFLILAGSSVVAWSLTTIFLYTNGKELSFIGAGLFFGLGHLVCITVAVLVSGFLNPMINLFTSRPN